ncbi:hypothetical protein HCI99_04350 [Listeria booriae]|uniref:Uncharacterized protein n=1 Tax=Listeria booriae TaxID=1552123 RepID=A0A7X0XBC1_9LIST|nr:hypothetical protein [Listeria booriae]MBC1491037.1 hypothetical protein [Listeria booriae]MBC1491048.1 hypothetical protein [Listeria booriae]MBC6151120.1 hypothetical protein [Listeria booriae]MBC6151131.1 hypothetical protein [Listeria booriae]
MKKYSDDYLIEEIKLCAKRLGHPPRVRDFPHYSLASKRFGSWKAFLEAAGLSIYNGRQIKSVNSRYGLAKAAQEQALTLGHAPNSNEFKYKHIVYEFFSSWDEFIKFTGLKPNEQFVKNKKVYTSEELVAEVRVVEANLGRIPKCYEVPHAVYAAVRKQYGGWKSFLFKEGFSEKAPTMNSNIHKGGEKV